MTENQDKSMGGDFETSPSTTIGIKTGCGTLYTTIVYDEKRRFKRIFIPRNSKFSCDLIVRDGLARMATYQGRRSLKQLIRDLRGDKFGHKCEKYNITSKATSCFDAVSRSLSLWLKRKRKKPSAK